MPDVPRSLPERVVPATLRKPWTLLTYGRHDSVRVDLAKSASTGLWYISKQEDNLPSDFGSTGLKLLPGLADLSNAFKVRVLLRPRRWLLTLKVQWACGVGTLAAGSTLTYFNLLN